MEISAATSLSNQILSKLGFSVAEAALITQNLIEAELVEKKTHGLIRLPGIAKYVASGHINVTADDIEITREYPGTLHFNAKHKPGFYALYRSLEIAIEKATKSGILAVAIKDVEYASGYIGDYARLAAEANLIFIGFNNSPGSLVPHGTTKNIWGTNPLTIGIPTHKIPVILDMASSKTTWGNILVSKMEGGSLPAGVAMDKDGNPTIDPAAAMEGGILPIAGHKGSGLAFIVELLAGALSNSRVGGAVKGGWGSFYILLNPAFFRDITEFKNDVEAAILELKAAPKATGFAEVFFPGEQSYYKRQKNLEKNEIEVSEKLMEELKRLK
jgi:LDH2 family malate/lactate/ureidoglycolate dehydrogenase